MSAYRIFPCDAEKRPLIKQWQQLATTDAEQIRLWQELFKSQLAYWGVPTGKDSDLLVLDVDTGVGKKDTSNGFDTLKTLPVPQTACQRTRSGGIHLLFRYPRDGRTYGNRVKFLPGLDTRGEGGYIIWYGADISQPIADPPDWLLTEAARPEVDHSGPVIKVAPEIAQKIIQSSLEAIREAPPGESNNILNLEAFRVGQLVASGSVSREYAEAALMRAARERGKPEYEAKRTIASGLDGGAHKPLTSPFGNVEPTPLFPLAAIAQAPTRWTPEPFTLHDLLNSSKLRKPQLFEHWSTEDITITSADGGTGKTTLKLFEAVCLALADRFLGFECKNPGRTLFITGEDTDKKLAAMLGAIMRQMGLFEEGIGNNEKVQTILHSILIKKDADLCLISKDRQGFLHPNRESLEKVLQAVEDFKPKMIVFDPISSFWGAESAVNDMAKAVIKFMSELQERSGACVEMINHIGKVSSATKDMSQFAGRGGTGLPSNSRVSRVLRSIDEEEYFKLTGEQLGERQSAMLCNVNKFTDGSPLYNKPFVILRDGYLFTRKALTPQKAREAEHEMRDDERIFTFVKEERLAGRWPNQDVIVSHFMLCGDPLSKERIVRGVKMLQYKGHMGEKLKMIENPDQVAGGKVFTVITDDGREV